MQKKLALKIAVIAFLTILLMVPLSLIFDQIKERKELQQGVVMNIADSAAGAQTIIGPVLVVHYREEVTEAVPVASTKNQGSKPTDLARAATASSADIERRHNTRTYIRTRAVTLAPESLKITGNTDVEMRSRGIYHANLFKLQAQLEGRATLSPYTRVEHVKLLDTQAFLVMGVSDLRGIGNNPQVLINNAPIGTFEAGNQEAFDSPGVYIALGKVDALKLEPFSFSFPLHLMGTQTLAIAPTAELTQVELQSPWPHPSFQGRFLPEERRVTEQGFIAQWQVTHLSRQFEKALGAGEPANYYRNREVLEIGLEEPVNIYLKSERAVKYGAIFIVLTFAAFFLLETLRRAPIHPLQYLLVGLALAIFFLLLIALSERIGFGIAYGISATACIALIVTYLSGVLDNRLHALAFGAGITSLYGILYGVLLSEDNAMLMGSALLFVALAAIMLSTRKTNWYELSSEVPPLPGAGMRGVQK